MAKWPRLLAYGSNIAMMVEAMVGPRLCMISENIV